MPKFRKKPVVIEARQYIKNSLEGDKITKWCNGLQTNARLIIATLEGNMFANDGDWIIKGIKGEFYPCRNDIFKDTYEAVI